MKKEDFDELMKIVNGIDTAAYHMDIDASFGNHVDRSEYFLYRDELIKKLEELKEED